MFRSKDKEKLNNKSAFVAAGLVMLICLISLVGATFALFTDTADTIGIIATSGNIDIDIVDANKNSLVGVGKVLNFLTTSGYDDGVLFEPGATFYTEGFYILNRGNIPVNYRVFISEDSNMDMDEFEKAFDFYITTDLSDSSAAQKLTEFYGRLEPDGNEDCISDTYYLVIKMKESATNEFQGKEYSGIGITVYAVQGNVNFEGSNNE